MPTSQNAQRCLELRRAGVPFDRIGQELGVTSAEARDLFVEALDANDSDYVNRLEADRLDRLLASVWPKAIAGELDAVDRAIAIGDRRQRLAAKARPEARHLREAFDESVTSSDQVQSVDKALIEAGRTIADRVDAAVALGEGQEVTKALYLMPHLVNILRELMATPSARLGVDKPKDNSGGKLAQLRAVQGGKPSAAKRARTS